MYEAIRDLLAEIDSGVWLDTREIGPDGDVTVIGPECFASADELVISWKGVNYYAPMGGAVSAAREAADA